MEDIDIILRWKERKQNLDSVVKDIIKFKEYLTEFDERLYGTVYIPKNSRKKSLIEEGDFDFDVLRKSLFKEYKKDLDENNYAKFGFMDGYYNEINGEGYGFGVDIGNDKGIGVNTIELSIPINYCPSNEKIIELFDKLVSYFKPEDGRLYTMYLYKNSEFIKYRDDSRYHCKVGWYVYTDKEEVVETEYLTAKKLEKGVLYHNDIFKKDKNNHISEVDKDCSKIWNLKI